MRAIIISSSDYSKVFNLVITLYNVTIIRVYHKSPKTLNSRNRPFSIISANFNWVSLIDSRYLGTRN